MRRVMRRLLLIAAALLGTAGCKEVGARCEVSGDGFQRTDRCRHTCVNWEITCPDGRQLTPDECAGALCSDENPCPEDQRCLQIDSFESNSRCMKANVCE